MMKKLLLVIITSLLIASPVYATTYYTATATGNDGNNGLTPGTAKKTIAGCLAVMSGGDTCNVRSGNYPESIFISIPSGTASSPTTLQVFSGDPAPVLKGSLTLAGENYITWSGINIDDAGDSGDTTDCIFIGTGHDITITGSPSTPMDIKNCQRHGVLTDDNNGAPLSNLKFTYLTVHNTGQGYMTSGDPRHHNFYIAAHSFTTGPILIDHVESYNTGNPANAGTGPNTAENSWGVQIYSTAPGLLNGVVLSNSYIHDNNQGVVVGSGANHRIFNNVIYHNDILPNTYCEGAVTIGYGIADNIQVYNNTIVGNACSYPVTVGQQYGAPTNSIIQNNIFYQNVDDIVFQNFGSGTVNTPNFAGNPLFVNPSSQDYHLQNGSTARAANGFAGANLYSIFTTDKDGNTRPSTGAWDAGAYTTTSSTPPPPPTPPATPVNFHIVP